MDKKIPGKTRLLIFLLFVWIAFIFIVCNLNYSFNTFGFFVCGIFPVVFVWGIGWVLKGFDLKKTNFSWGSYSNSDAKKKWEGDSVNAVSEEAIENYEGIEGWLLLPALSMITSPLIAFMLLTFTWENVTRPLNSVSLLIIAILVGIFLLTLRTSYLFFKKRKSAPRYVILTYISFAAVSLLELLIENLEKGFLNQQNVGEYAKIFITTAIWVSYFLVSKRVKNTFTKQ